MHTSVSRACFERNPFIQQSKSRTSPYLVPVPAPGYQSQLTGDQQGTSRGGDKYKPPLICGALSCLCLGNMKRVACRLHDINTEVRLLTEEDRRPA